MKSGLQFVLVCLAAFMFIGAETGGCWNSGAPQGRSMGSLSIHLGVVVQKTIWPLDWADSIGSFEIQVFPGDADLSTDVASHEVVILADESGGEVVFDDVLEGDYFIVVTGHCLDSLFCDDAASIAFGRMDDPVSVERDETATATVIVRPLVDAEIKGSLDLTLDWPDIELINVLDVEVFLRGSAEAWPDEPTRIYDFHSSAANSLSFLEEEAEAGSNMLLFKLYGESGEQISSVIQIVNVYSNYISVGTITLVEDDFLVGDDPDVATFDLRLRVNWNNGDDETLYFPHTGDWELNTAPSLHLDSLDSPDWEIVIQNASDEEGLVGFQVLQGDSRNWDSCWHFDGWTLDGAALDGNNCQVIVDCSATDELLEIHVDLLVDTNELIAECYTGKDEAGTGSLDVRIELDDPVPAEDLRIDCLKSDELLECTASGDFSDDADFEWFLNGITQVGMDQSEVTFENPSLGDRISLIVSDIPFSQSAQFTVTAVVLGDDQQALIPIEFDFSTESLESVTGTSELFREPGFAGTFNYTVSEASVRTNQWNDGANIKYWMISFSTQGFDNIVLSSDQYSSATGPRDFGVQWKVADGDWQDLDGGELVLGSSFDNGAVLDNIPLPAATFDQEQVSVRWVMTSNISVRAGTDDHIIDEAASSGGTSRIRNIEVGGSEI